MDARSGGDFAVARQAGRDWFALALLALSGAVAVFFLAGLWRAAVRSPHAFTWALLTRAVAAGGFFLLVIVLAGWQVAHDRNRRTPEFRWSLWLLIAAGMCHLGVLALDSTSLAVRRAQPIADAIVRFETDHGAAPAGLQSLVPDYLPSVPHRFTSTFQVLTYHRDDERPRAWRLMLIGYPEWFFGHWELDYEPDTETPRAEQDHSVDPFERFGDWALRKVPF